MSMGAFGALRLVRKVRRVSKLGAKVGEQAMGTGPPMGFGEGMSLIFLARSLMMAQPEIAAILIALFAGEMIFSALSPALTKDQQRKQSLIDIYGIDKGTA